MLIVSGKHVFSFTFAVITVIKGADLVMEMHEMTEPCSLPESKSCLFLTNSSSATSNSQEEGEVATLLDVSLQSSMYTLNKLYNVLHS